MVLHGLSAALTHCLPAMTAGMLRATPRAQRSSPWCYRYTTAYRVNNTKGKGESQRPCQTRLVLASCITNRSTMCGKIVRLVRFGLFPI